MKNTTIIPSFEIILLKYLYFSINDVQGK